MWFTESALVVRDMFTPTMRTAAAVQSMQPAAMAELLQTAEPPAIRITIVNGEIRAQQRAQITAIRKTAETVRRETVRGVIRAQTTTDLPGGTVTPAEIAGALAQSAGRVQLPEAHQVAVVRAVAARHAVAAETNFLIP